MLIVRFGACRVVPRRAWPGGCPAVFGPEHTGQLGVMSDMGPASPQQPRRRKAPTLWQSSWGAVSSLGFGVVTLGNFFSPGRGPWWLHLVFGSLFVLFGLANLRNALKILRNRRRLADSATADANRRL
jgi:hypothetical protein